MASVTSRIAKISQPRGGYLKPSKFTKIVYDDGIVLNDDECLHSSVIGLAVDYLTRFVSGRPIIEAFMVSLRGAYLADKLGVKDSIDTAAVFLSRIRGLDDESIVNACKLVTFDVWFRNPLAALLAKNHADTNPDNATIENIRLLVNRSITFLKKYGPIIKDGFSFSPTIENKEQYDKMVKSKSGTYGGYTATVDSGDGDFLTADTLWDFKTSKSPLTNKQTLQLLMYWIMGQHSGQEVFKSITKLGVFNPRLNTVYLLEIKDIPDEIIQAVEADVICYQ